MQLPVIVDAHSEPEPDFAIVPLDPREWRDRHPTAQDVLLLVEVSDSRRDFDLHKKAPVYARAAIRELWVVDVVDRRIVTHRAPKDGRYTMIRIFKVGERLAPLAFPGDEFDVHAMTG